MGEISAALGTVEVLPDADDDGQAGIGRGHGAAGYARYARGIEVLFVCTANMCRSPMAEALLSHYAAEWALDVTVKSAGLLEGGRPVTAEGLETMARRGIDTSGHRSQELDREVLAGADLIVGMTRQHIREIVTLAPALWPKAFTFKELVRRGEAVGGRRPDQPLEGWLAEISRGRTHAELTGDALRDDVADPVGLGGRAYERTALELDDLVLRLIRLLWPAAARVTQEEQPA